MRRLVLYILLLLTGALSHANAPEYIVIQSGHTGAITKLAAAPVYEFLVSIGEDGTLRVWNRTTHALVQRIQVSPLPLVDLAIHPSLPRVAVIESDGIRVHRLSVWDWSENRRVFTRDLETLPLYLSFSPGGSFLAYSVADWQSMTILDAGSGSRPSYLQNGFGIVSAFRISSSEQRILAYLPSGTIQYRDLRSGSLVQEYRTLANVKESYFISGNRYMIGRWEDSLVALDMLSGVDVASIRLPNLLSYSADEATGTIICTIGPDTDGNSASIQTLAFSGTGFDSGYSRYVPPEGFSSNQIEVSKSLYSGTESGAIYYQTSTSIAPKLFSGNRLLPVDDFDALDSLIISTAATIVTLYADLLYRTDTSESDSVLTYAQPNPLGSPVLIHPFGNGLYALQDTGGLRGRYQLFNPVEGPIGPPHDLSPGPIVSLDIKDQRVLTVDASGKIQIFNLQESKFDFETEVFGIHEAIFVQGNSIVVGGRRSQLFGTSMLLVDASTGETVPFNDTSLETYHLAYDHLSHTLYTLSLEGVSMNPRTVLTRYSGVTFERKEVLFTMPGSFSDSSIHVNRGTLFLSAGGINRALYPGTDRFMPVDGNDNIPVKVEVIDNWFIGLNRDSSFTVWERATGRLVVNFYLFDDMNWVALTPSGSLATSAVNVSAYIEEYKQATILQ